MAVGLWAQDKGVAKLRRPGFKLFSNLLVVPKGITQPLATGRPSAVLPLYFKLCLLGLFLAILEKSGGNHIPTEENPINPFNQFSFSPPVFPKELISEEASDGGVLPLSQESFPAAGELRESASVPQGCVACGPPLHAVPAQPVHRENQPLHRAQQTHKNLQVWRAYSEMGCESQ
ncbi:hypothetical protein CB1_001683032 [Camelus ferus]|nr:hypothetical protein CB1_001683032 [Camelus ferus]